MAERPITHLAPEDLLQVKDAILEQWGRLPPEHQATLTLVLFQQTLEGEYGPWLRSAVATLEDEQPPAYKVLPITSVTRAQLALADLTEEEIARLDDDDLWFITYDVMRHFANDIFWEELEYMARCRLAGKEKK